MSLEKETPKKDYESRKKQIQDLILNYTENDFITLIRNKMFSLQTDYYFIDYFEIDLKELMKRLDQSIEERIKKDKDLISTQIQNISKKLSKENKRIKDLIASCISVKYFGFQNVHIHLNGLSKLLENRIKKVLDERKECLISKIKSISNHEKYTLDQQIEYFGKEVEKLTNKYLKFNINIKTNKYDSLHKVFEYKVSEIKKFQDDCKLREEYEQFIKELDDQIDQDSKYEQFFETFNTKFINKDPVIDSSIAYIKIRTIKDKTFDSVLTNEQIKQNIYNLKKIPEEIEETKENSKKKLSQDEADIKKEYELKLQTLQKEYVSKVNTLNTYKSEIETNIKIENQKLEKLRISQNLFKSGFESYEDSYKKMSQFYKGLQNYPDNGDYGHIEICCPLGHLTRQAVCNFITKNYNFDEIKLIIEAFEGYVKYDPKLRYRTERIKRWETEEYGGGMCVRDVEKIETREIAEYMD